MKLSLVPGELARFNACPDGLGFGWELISRWRKDGAIIVGATNGTLMLTNVQPANAGVYDLEVFATYNFQGVQTGAQASQKYYLSIQTSNGQGILLSPRMNNSNFVCDLLGIADRSYAIQSSTNLIDWVDILTVTNTTGTVTFTNTTGGNASRYYRAILLPLLRF